MGTVGNVAKDAARKVDRGLAFGGGGRLVDDASKRARQAGSFLGDPDTSLGLLEEARPPTGDSTDSRLAALRRAETEKKLREARGRKSSFMFGGESTIGNGFKPDNILGSRRS